MSEELRSILTGTAGLSVAALVAFLLTVTRSPIDGTGPSLGRFRVHVGLVIVLQGLHFGEELVMRFYGCFPELLGLSEWPVGFFVYFNLFWIVVWSASVVTLPMYPRVAIFPVWFLGIACLANGLAHPALSVVRGGYFPGLVTSPLVGIAGVWLLRRLAFLTARSDVGEGAAQQRAEADRP